MRRLVFYYSVSSVLIVVLIRDTMLSQVGYLSLLIGILPLANMTPPRGEGMPGLPCTCHNAIPDLEPALGNQEIKKRHIFWGRFTITLPHG